MYRNNTIMSSDTVTMTLYQLAVAYERLMLFSDKEYDGKTAIAIARLLSATKFLYDRYAKSTEAIYKKYQDSKYYFVPLGKSYDPTTQSLTPEARQARKEELETVRNEAIKISSSLLLNVSLIEAIRISPDSVQQLSVFIAI